MAELPEIMRLTDQISHELLGKEIESADVRQEKCLNIHKGQFEDEIIGKKILGAYNKGKWIITLLSDDKYLLLNVGMGGDILYYPSKANWPSEYQCRFHFADASGFTCKFWWFGHIQLLNKEQLNTHKETMNIGMSPLEDGFTREYFHLLSNRNKASVKNFILDQKKIGGIGNMYIHDILFQAGLHPLKKMDTLSSQQKDLLYDAIVTSMKKACQNNGCAYEKDFYGKIGQVSMDWFSVGYKEGNPCPKCNSKIEKIKTGGTSSFVCMQCQVK